MKALRIRHIAPSMVGLVLLIGCRPTDTPMQTTGPNQVVIKVPGMT